MKKNFGVNTLLIGWPLLFWAAAFFLPLAAALSQGLLLPGGFAALKESSRTVSLTLFTLQQAALSTLFSVLFGLPGAYFMGRRSFPGQKNLKALATVPFVLPPILAVLGFILVFGNRGLINTLRFHISGGGAEPWKILYSLKAIIMAHVFYNFPLTMRIVGDAWRELPSSTRRAARSLGASSWKAFIHTDLPRLLPSVLTAAVMTFLFCFLSFAVILVLGGGPALSTLEVEVYRLIKQQMDFQKGGALALVESSIALSLLALYIVFQKKLSRGASDDARSSTVRAPLPLKGWSFLAGLLYLLPAFLLIAVPLASVVVNSFFVKASRQTAAELSLHHWRNLLGGTLENAKAFRPGGGVALKAVLRTAVLGAAVSVLTALTASAAAWYTVRRGGKSGRVLEGLLFIPMGVSSIILGFGFLVLVHRLPSGRFFRLAALTAAHSTMALPFACRIITGRLRQISPRIPQASRAAGAGALRSLFLVEIPMARRSLVTAAVFSFALSAGELNTTLILSPGNFTTLPLAVYRMIGAYNIHGACALGTILILISCAGFLALERAEGA